MYEFKYEGPNQGEDLALFCEVHDELYHCKCLHKISWVWKEVVSRLMRGSGGYNNGYQGVVSIPAYMLLGIGHSNVFSQHMWILYARTTKGHQWDPGGQLQLDTSMATRSSSFKQWDPGKLVQQ